MVTGQAGEFWFPPNKTQPNVLRKAIGSLFPILLLYIGVYLGDLH